MPRGWKRRKGAALLISAVALALPAKSVPANPRYSMRVGQKCSLCHLNPTGGGIRDPYATQYLIPERLAMRRGPRETPLPNPQISEGALVGADLRTFFLRSWPESISAGRSNFVEMQGAVYVALQPDPRVALYVHEEFGQGSAQAFEVWALGYLLPATGYLKVGRFTPAFGWKLRDHRSFTRRSFVFLPENPPHGDTGIEIGFQPGSLTFQAALLNGSYRSAFDADSRLAYAARVSYRHSLPSGNAVLGGSYYRNRGAATAFFVGDREAFGPFAGFMAGPLSWIGELDWTRSDRAGDSSRERTISLTSSQELALRILQGFDLLVTHDFHDPDTGLATGAVQRIGAGLEILPEPFLGLRAKIHRFVVEKGRDLRDQTGYETSFTQLALEIHVLY